MPFIPAINPSDPENIFVSCDMTGSYVTYDGGEKWRMFNLRGVTRFYAFERNESDVVYAGTSNMLFKSLDKGVSWSTIYPTPSDIVAIHAQGDHAEENVITLDSTVTVDIPSFIANCLADNLASTNKFLRIFSSVSSNFILYYSEKFI